MRVATIREFRDTASAMLRGREPVLVLRRGAVAGIFFPQPGKSIPLEMKRELFAVLGGEVARRLRARRATERNVLDDFKSWRRSRRAARR